MGRPKLEINTGSCVAEEGCAGTPIIRGQCSKHAARTHYRETKRDRLGRAPARRCSIGDKMAFPSGYVSVKIKDGAGWSCWQPEHRLVMERMIGRPLLPDENVHHRNGVRNDNRPENLELWTTKQPKGQRAADLLAWAHEIIARYG